MIPSGGSGIRFPVPEEIVRIHRRLLRWYKRHARVLPWRDRDDTYAVLVSEFMLQQTQASRVSEKLPLWLGRFPDIPTLANASRRSVLLAWSGMGYNRRAIALHETAKAITTECNGHIPDAVDALRALPGIGAYTAHAIICFGHRKRAAMVDVNIRRIFSRLLSEQANEADMLPEAQAWDIARALLPKRSFYNWNQALMDLGAMICTARLPSCDLCPLAAHCNSRGRMAPVTRATTGMVRETPRRIYRGRIVEELRNAPRHQLRASELLRSLYDGQEDGQQLLADALASLRRDGLVTLRPDNGAASPVQLLVRLAE
jgi:A/G-specific adenine glycosylase